jgi:hypothetical protein
MSASLVEHGLLVAAIGSNSAEGVVGAAAGAVLEEDGCIPQTSESGSDLGAVNAQGLSGACAGQPAFAAQGKHENAFFRAHYAGAFKLGQPRSAVTAFRPILDR